MLADQRDAARKGGVGQRRKRNQQLVGQRRGQNRHGRILAVRFAARRAAAILGFAGTLQRSMLPGQRALPLSICCT
ncbi:hypothetical protein DEG02_021010 [Xanthomonas vasicola]|nr:hypothetical protein DEG03_021655 [Xanthomonas vasicola]RJL81839.1 hypothetical protein DEF98_021115 [Xanthomonas vasicola]RJL92521.1 hypothetical protein DEF96_021245 [Xanthomonas vasicola]RJN01675.1 hypothetical protein DEF99_021305 [Xanthomonas vasicola]RJN19460.1 hypothetical protein DEG04_021270 [Xanthomonas vasicola]